MKGRFDWKTLLEQGKNYQYALLILLVGVVLLLLPSNSEQNTTTTTSQTTAQEEDFDLSALEQRLGDSLSKIQGVGKAEVILTLESGSRKILAEDREEKETESQTTTVVIDSGSGQETVVTTQVIYPVFQGALVVCDGGGNATVRLNVLKAVEALTGLKADNISICARTGGSEP
jgi:stage III sporulation protein AG